MKSSTSQLAKKLYRDALLRFDSGTTLEEYNELLVAQDFGCAICKAPPSSHLDYDNSSSAPRLLCRSCRNVVKEQGREE